MKHRPPFRIAFLSPAMLLTACGGGAGGGGGMASTPPPIASMAAFTKPQLETSQCDALTSCTVSVSPLPSSPADAAGTYDTVALKRTASGELARFAMTARAGDLQIRVNPANGTYTMILDDGSSPRVERSFGAVNGLGNAFSVTGVTKPWYDDRGNQVSPGGQRVTYDGEARVLPADSRNNGQFQYQWGLRHVSLGMWAAPVADGSSTGSATFYFTHGNRTAVGDVPTAGSASYRLAYSEGTQLGNATTTLTADFASRSLIFSSRVDPARHVFEDGVAWGDGFSISGNATIASSSNLFTGPLTGTLFHFTDGSVSGETVNIDLAGQWNGGFFGPQAAELGAVWFASSPDRAFGLSGAFVGARTAP